MEKFSKEKLSPMSGDEFVKNLEAYKSFKNKGYKPNMLPIIGCFLLICSPALLLLVLNFSVFNTFQLETDLSKIHDLFLIVATLTILQIVFFIYFVIITKLRILKCDDLFRVISDIENSSFKGDLCEIFNKECSVTRSVINQNKEKLTDDVCEYKALSGKLILTLFTQIEKEKTKKEEMEVMISCNTRSGKMLKDINEFPF